jgi:hypothetical protein
MTLNIRLPFLITDRLAPGHGQLTFWVRSAVRRVFLNPMVIRHQSQHSRRHYVAIPTRNAKARLTRSTRSSSNRPILCAIRVRDTVVTLSIISWDNARRPLLGDGSTVRRKRGAVRERARNRHNGYARVRLVEQV